MQATLATVGLMGEIIGGFLISIDLLWNVNKLVATVARVRAWLSAYGIRVAVVSGFIGAVADAAMTSRSVPEALWAFARVGAGAALIVLALFGASLVLGGFLMWVGDDEAGAEGGAEVTGGGGVVVAGTSRERRIGQFGFVVLLLGLVLQGSVNLMQADSAG